ncbi:MAG: ABC transporter permease subunit [Dehalococcoidia bacterium]|jgi:ABC-type Na+ efflux pump permease subunit
MKTILVISKREIARLTTRFRGRSLVAVLALVILTIIGSYIIYHQDLAISKNMYNVGVSADTPAIYDSRFNIIPMERAAGYRGVQDGIIDVYLDGDNIVSGDAERSEYAAGALAQYLQKQDLLRIAGEYEIDQAFPLRIEIGYLDTEWTGPVTTETPEAESPEATSSPALPPDDPHGTPPETVPAAPSASDEAVRQQLEDFVKKKQLPEFRAEFVAENDIIIPSLTTPPIPLAQVIIAFLYIVPVFFVSIFFTSSFTEEKVSRKLIVLLSAPVTRIQIILGKMLPYLAYSILIIIGATLVLGGNVLLGLAIFIPVMLFIFSIYLMVALTYRTFKDQTFFSMLAVSLMTVYLVGPAIFAGVNDLSYISPLTLAVDMYRGESFGASEYFLATTPLLLVFALTMFVATRVFNEEYLMSFRPLHVKAAEAISLAMGRTRMGLSTMMLSMFLVPLVLMVELAVVLFVTNLSLPFMMGLILIISAIVEETAKSAGVAILLHKRIISRKRDVLKLAALSALGFMLAEKLLLLIVMSVVSDSLVVRELFSGGLILVPLALHVVATSVVCLSTARFGTRFYPLAVVFGSLIHVTYNLTVVGITP